MSQDTMKIPAAPKAADWNTPRSNQSAELVPAGRRHGDLDASDIVRDCALRRTMLRIKHDPMLRRDFPDVADLVDEATRAAERARFKSQID